MLNFKVFFMASYQISLRVEKKVPFTANMAHSFSILILGQDYSVMYSDPRERVVMAYAIPLNVDESPNIDGYNRMPKKDQKKVRHTILAEIRANMKRTNS